MTLPTILLPVFVQVMLTFILLGMLGRARFAAGRRGEVKLRDIALDEKAWPDSVRQISNSYNTQFQLPLLFVAATILAIIAHKADIVFVALGWTFVLLRVAHAYVHCTSNVVLVRFRLFLTGMIVLAIMWLWLALKVMLGL